MSKFPVMLQNGRGPLLLAAAGGHMEVCNALLLRGVHVSETDNVSNVIYKFPVSHQQGESLYKFYYIFFRFIFFSRRIVIFPVIPPITRHSPYFRKIAKSKLDVSQHKNYYLNRYKLEEIDL